MSTISWFSIFSGFSAREIKSLMFDRISVERRSKIPMGTLEVLAGRHCPALNLRSCRSASMRSAKSNRSASSETWPWSCATCSSSAATRCGCSPATPHRTPARIRIRSAIASPTGVRNTQRRQIAQPTITTRTPITGMISLNTKVGSNPGRGGGVGIWIMSMPYAFPPTDDSRPGPARRREPATLVLLREQPLRKIYALRELRHFASDHLELLLERLPVLDELAPQLTAVDRHPLAPDALGEGLADGRDGQQEQRATPEDEHDGENGFDIHGQRGGARRSALRSCFAACTASHCSSCCDQPRIHSASAFPTGPDKITVAPMTSARPIIPTAGTHSAMRPYPPSSELIDLVARRQHLAQELAGERALHARDVLRRACGHHRPARRAALGPEVDHPIGGLHHVEVVLDHDHRVPLVHQPVQHLEEQADVLEVEARRRLVQDVEGTARVALGQLGGELDPLRLAAGQRRRRLAEVDVAQSYVVQELQFRADARLVLEEVQRLGDRQREHVGDRLSFIPDLERLAVVAPPFAHLARDVDVRKEVHLHFHQPVALARLAAPALHVEGKPPRAVPPELRFGEVREQLADRREQPRVGGGVGARRAPDGTLIDVDHLVDL